MKLTKDIRSITYLRRNAAKALDELNATGRPLVITQSGKTRAVIQDPESYERMVHALANMKLLAMGEKDVQTGNTKQQDAFFDQLEKRFFKAK